MNSVMFVRSVRLTTTIAALSIFWLLAGTSGAGVFWVGMLVVAAASFAIAFRVTGGLETRPIVDVLHDVDAEMSPAIAVRATGAVSTPRPPGRSA